MYSFQEYRDAARADGVPEHIIDLGLSFARPRIELSSKSGGGVLAGQYGGHPHLPPDAEWDGLSDFVASIDCAALPQDVLDIPLPRDGNLLFFAEKRYWHNEDVYQVIHVPAGAATSERLPPENDENPEDWAEEASDPYTEPYPLYARLSWSLPSDADEALSAAGPENEEIFENYNLEYYGRPHMREHPDFLLGGYARSPQDPPALHAISEKEGEEWVLLAQAQYEFSYEPDRMACPFWCIRRSDLAAKDFTDMYMLLLAY